MSADHLGGRGRIDGGAPVNGQPVDPRGVANGSARHGTRISVMSVTLMIRTAACAALLTVIPAAAQQPALQPGEVLVRVETLFGAIDLAVDAKRAPVTAANFLKYVDGGFYDGGRFHRVTRADNYTPVLPNRPKMEIIQAGINPARRSEGFPAIALERTSVTGLKHVVGTVSMARAPAADSARSDFFICLDDQPSLDFGGLRFDDGQGAAAFGRVVAGMEVVRKINQQPAEKQVLAPPVTIAKAARVPPAR